MSVIGKDTTFLGYRRENGRVGVRNHVIVLPLDDLSNAAAEAVAHNIKGAMAIPHPYGRLQFGADLDLHFRTLIGLTTLPMSMPYLRTVSPTAMSRRATLWPIGMSCRAVTRVMRSSSMIQPDNSMPAFTPSVTTTATLSFASCNTK